MNDIPLLKRQVEMQLDEYEQAIADYAKFMEGWRALRAEATNKQSAQDYVAIEMEKASCATSAR